MYSLTQSPSGSALLWSESYHACVDLRDTGQALRELPRMRAPAWCVLRWRESYHACAHLCGTGQVLRELPRMRAPVWYRSGFERVTTHARTCVMRAQVEGEPLS